MKFLSIDLETTGLSADYCQILQCSGIIFDTENPKPFHECDSFDTLISHPQYTTDDPKAYALSLNSWIFDQLSNRVKPTKPIVEIKHLNELLHLFLNDNLKDQEKIVIAGKNAAGFDIPFLKNIPTPNHVNITERFDHRVLDPGSMFSLSQDKTPPGLKECLKRAGITKEVTHDALDDCWDVVQCVKTFLQKG